jgi:hypothetical protein
LALLNKFYATHKYCNLGEVQYVLDGDDELIGRQVFKVINAVYSKEKVLTLYTNHIIARGNPNQAAHYLGLSKPYLSSDVASNNFRKTKNRGYSHMRTMMTDLYLLMKPQSFQDANGKFYWTITDNA